MLRWIAPKYHGGKRELFAPRSSRCSPISHDSGAAWARGFSQDDPLFVLAQQAELAMRRLRDDLRARDSEDLKVVESHEPLIEINVENPRTLEMRERAKRDRLMR